MSERTRRTECDDVTRNATALYPHPEPVGGYFLFVITAFLIVGLSVSCWRNVMTHICRLPRNIRSYPVFLMRLFTNKLKYIENSFYVGLFVQKRKRVKTASSSVSGVSACASGNRYFFQSVCVMAFWSILNLSIRSIRKVLTAKQGRRTVSEVLTCKKKLVICIVNKTMTNTTNYYTSMENLQIDANYTQTRVQCHSH